MSVTAKRIAWLTPHGGMPSRSLTAWCRERDPAGILILVPTATARQLFRSSLARGTNDAAVPRVLSWRDLWADIRRSAAVGPRVLDQVGQRFLVDRAIDACVSEGRFAEAGELVRTAGFRHLLGARLEAWSASWEHPGQAPPIGATADEWAAFGHARRLMAKAHVTDDAGLARWASRSGRFRQYLRQAGVTAAAIADVSRLGPGAWKALATLCEHVEAIAVSVPGEREPGREILCRGVEWCCERLRGMGFDLVPGQEEPRPAGLDAVRRSLFRLGARLADRGEGVRIEGMPEGAGEALGAARAVRAALASGAEPDDVLVLVPYWSELASLALATLREWGIPCSGGPPVPLARDAGVTCLLSVAALPSQRWDARRVASILRHGRVTPRWEAVSEPRLLAQAARALIECQGFRDLSRLRAALERRARPSPPARADAQAEARARSRARIGLDVLTALGRLFADTPQTWSDSVARLDRIIEVLGLDRNDAGGAIEALREAVSTQGRLLAAIGQEERPWTWDLFTAELRNIAREVTIPPESFRAGTVRIATVDEAWGAEVSWRVLLGATEGTFPTSKIVRSTWTADPGTENWIEEETLAREMRRFLDLAASTRRGLTIIHGSTDEKGQPLLRAGFVDELAGLFAGDLQQSVVGETRLLRPVLDDSLAVSAREARVAALARALEGFPNRILERARRPGEHVPMGGVATALRVIHFRTRERFSHHDGVLSGDRTIRTIAREFDERAAELSPSQLETYALCPFRYYLRYVLGIEAAEVDELREDLTERGRVLHRVLEEFHRLLRREEIEPGPTFDPRDLLERFGRLIDAQLAQAEEVASELEECFRALDRLRLEEHCRIYVDQCAAYLAETPRAVPHQFELGFGTRGDLPPLRLGPDRRGRTILVQGVVDRVDLIEFNDQRFFRVIDYKSGAVPTREDLRSGRALQLPLYSLAVERLHFADGAARPAEMGYWGLKEGVGYRRLYPPARKKASISDAAEGWSRFAERLERFVFELADRIRAGEFPVAPTTDDCERSCDYRTTCRIRQLSHRGKSWDRRPRWDPSEEPES